MIKAWEKILMYVYPFYGSFPLIEQYTISIMYNQLHKTINPEHEVGIIVP